MTLGSLLVLIPDGDLLEGGVIIIMIIVITISHRNPHVPPFSLSRQTGSSEEEEEETPRGGHAGTSQMVSK